MTQVSIFNIGQNAAAIAEEHAAEQGERQPSNLFNPQAEKVGDTLTIIARIMPVVKRVLDNNGNQVEVNGVKQYEMSDAVSKNIISKFFYAPRHGNQTIWFDSPQNAGKYCPMADMWRELYNSQDPNVKNFSKTFNRKQSTTCYLQIIKAPEKYKDLIGKIVPFAVPFELTKFMNAMISPSADDRAMGIVPILPYDIINAYPLKLSYTAESVQGIEKPVRKWTVERYIPQSGEIRNEAYFLVDGKWQYATTLGEQAVLEHIASQEVEDIELVYGYHEPDNETIYRLYNWLRDTISWLPGMLDKVNANLYFKWCSDRYNVEHGIVNQPAPQTVNAQVQQPVPEAPAAPQPVPEAPAAPQPVPEAPAAPQPVPEAPAGQIPNGQTQTAQKIGIDNLPV